MNGPAIQLECFQGPLDLLLYLVRKHEVDVLEVSLHQVVRQYLEAVEALQAMRVDEIGEFLVLASELLELKSRALLPGADDDEADDAIESPRQELVRRLLEYRRFRDASALLGERAEQQRQKLHRLANDSLASPTDPATQSLRDLELWDLVSAFSRLLKENVVPIAERVVIDQTPITVYQDRLEAMVLASSGLTLRELFGLANSRSQIIGKFLALLELVKMRRVWVELSADSQEIRVLPPSLAPVLTSETEGESHPMGDDTPPPSPSAAREPEGDGSSNGWGEARRTADPPRASAWADFEPIFEDDGVDSEAGD